MKTLTKEEILSIIEMKKLGLTNKEVGKKLGVHPQTIVKRIKQLREKGYEVYTKAGRRPVL